MQKASLMQARILVGDLPRYPVRNQIADCEAAIAVLGDAVTFDSLHVYGPNEFEQFVNDVSPRDGRAPTTVAVLSRLLVLDERPAPPGGVGNAFHARLRRLTRAVAYIVDVQAGRTSNHGDSWDAHVDAVAGQVSKMNRKPGRKEAQAMNRKSYEAREKNLERHWNEKGEAGDNGEGDEDYERVLLHWQNTTMSAEAAIANAP